MDQIKGLYKISQILAKAFKEVNDVCAHLMADNSIQDINNHAVQRRSKPEKPSLKISNLQTQKHRSQKIVPNHSQKIPQKIQSQGNGKSKALAHPDRPKQPLTAFFLFQQDQKDNVKKFHPNASITDLAKMMGQIWRGLDQSEKDPYLKRHNQLNVKYEKDIKKFYDKHPQQKTKKLLKQQKAQKRKVQQSEASSHNQQRSSSNIKSTKKPIIIEQQNSQSL